MLNEIVSYYSQFQQLMRDNQFVAGAVSLWGLGVITFVLREMPKKITQFFIRQLTTHIVFNNSTAVSNEMNFISFMEWYKKTKYIRYSRALSLETKNWRGDSTVGPGVGKHFFFYKKSLFWFTFIKLESSGTSAEKREITIHSIGRDQTKLLDLVDEFKFKPEERRLGVFVPKGGDWEKISNLHKRDIKTTVLNKEKKDKLIADIKHLLDNEQWYVSKGLPWKKTFALFGPPGTGKSALILAMCSYFERNLCLINLSITSNGEFEKLMRTIPDNSFVGIEDFGTIEAVQIETALNTPRYLRARQNDVPVSGISDSDGEETIAEAPVASGDVKPEIKTQFSPLNLTTILNALCGPIKLHNTVVFLTTNNLDNIDAAVRRRGRIDREIEIPLLENAEIYEYIHLMYPDYVVPNYQFGSIAGAEIQDLFMEHKEDVKSFIEALPITHRIKPIEPIITYSAVNQHSEN